MLDFVRIACAVPPVKVGDVKKNTEDICERIAQADAQGCDLIVFPELALTGYSCADLLFQSAKYGFPEKSTARPPAQVQSRNYQSHPPVR